LRVSRDAYMDRYDRQMMEFSEEEQDLIRSARVGVIGCGGLGCSVCTSLAMAGVGHLTVMDPDTPEISNLNRQFVYSRPIRDGDKRYKAEIMAEWITDINDEVEVEAHVNAFDETSWSIFDDCDIMVDCLDSISVRKTLNRYCVARDKPLVHGGIDGFEGELCTIIPGRTPCLECMMKDIYDSDSAAASIGSIVMAVGAMQATDVLKLITGRGAELVGSFLSVDFASGRFSSIRFNRDPNCPVCKDSEAFQQY